MLRYEGSGSGERDRNSSVSCGDVPNDPTPGQFPMERSVLWQRISSQATTEKTHGGVHRGRSRATRGNEFTTRRSSTALCDGVTAPCDETLTDIHRHDRTRRVNK
ncbi:hypothetical protein EYF80_066375 [Liparis tanakae]|uniref:Uncharacterized protein n=1 Tax=Liparis tanakae TaxID=230148 RepID=A0A4Z2E4G6_9TELE|nr:hypothetical protein EYF80_066375 [Liparis tanakae]